MSLAKIDATFLSLGDDYFHDASAGSFAELMHAMVAGLSRKFSNKPTIRILKSKC